MTMRHEVSPSAGGAEWPDELKLAPGIERHAAAGHPGLFFWHGLAR